MITILLTFISSLLWRVRGGLLIKSQKIPLNKIWFSVFFALYGLFYYEPKTVYLLVGFIASYTSYQLYGWGLYIGSLLTGLRINPKKDKECELIDNILYNLHIKLKGTPYYLYQYPRLFGFCGTCLTGLIITFIWGLFLGSLWVMVSGLAMGICYWIGSKIERLYSLGKNGWNWGEWIFGAYLGLILGLIL